MFGSKNGKSANLSPAQTTAIKGLDHAVKVGSVIHFWSRPGRGRSTVLREFHRQHGGRMIASSDIIEAARNAHPNALEETMHVTLLTALKEHSTVIVDDFHLFDIASSGCHFYPRGRFIDVTVEALCQYAIETGKKLILGTKGKVSAAASSRSHDYSIGRFTVDDYAHLLGEWLGKKAASKIDFDKLFRFAPKLNAHQLKGVCSWLEGEPVTTETLIDFLRSQRLASNVDLGEVQTVDIKELRGVDDVVRSLEINIAVPLENDDLAEKYQLRPKRGVLLYGPPGTGKTTVGRALAHRLKGKFLLIDGTFIAGTDDFYKRIHRVFEAAKENAPSVIFIDDADAIFEQGEEQGLYRYLLTMLDGLESESAGRVCVMMTAMNVADLPAALIRSGRVELWLEMKTPNAEARGQILADQAAKLPAELRDLDMAAVVNITEEFTGSDLKRVIEDGKALYAYDQVKKATGKPTTDYFLSAVETVRENKQRYSEAASQSAGRQRNSGNMPYAMSMMMAQQFQEDNE